MSWLEVDEPYVGELSSSRSFWMVKAFAFLAARSAFLTIAFALVTAFAFLMATFAFLVTAFALVAFMFSVMKKLQKDDSSSKSVGTSREGWGLLIR